VSLNCKHVLILPCPTRCYLILPYSSITVPVPVHQLLSFTGLSSALARMGAWETSASEAAWVPAAAKQVAHWQM